MAHHGHLQEGEEAQGEEEVNIFGPYSRESSLATVLPEYFTIVDTIVSFINLIEAREKERQIERKRRAFDVIAPLL